jgi:hypothetical protein
MSEKRIHFFSLPGFQVVDHKKPDQQIIGFAFKDFPDFGLLYFLPQLV